MADSKPLLVTGGSGHLARSVIEHLLRAGCEKVVTTTRSPDSLADLARRGVEVRFADHDDPASLRDAYRGVGRMLVISTVDVGRRAEQVRNVVEAAVQSGVEHLLYTSTIAPKPNPENPIEIDHFWSEREIFASPLSWTILRHAMYAEHIYLTLPVAVARGRLLSVMKGRGRSYVTREDCARTDAAALMSADRTCRILDVTGPEAVTNEKLASIASQLTGSPIEVIDAEAEVAVREWVEAGLPEPLARGVLEFEELGAQGYHGVVTTTVEQYSGSAPETVESYLRRTSSALYPDREGKPRIDPHNPAAD